MEWRPVAGYETYYAVSDQGDVCRVAGGRGARAGKQLKPIRHSAGYRTVTLVRGGIEDKCLIHRLVLEAFVGPCPAGCCANHRDGDKTNNWVANLEWATVSDNNSHAYRTGLKRRKWTGIFVPPPRRGEESPTARLKEAEVREIRESALSGKQLAIRYKVAESTISSIRRRHIWRHI